MKCVVLIVLACSVAASASEYYVNAATGDDARGKGSVAAPWRNITRATRQRLRSGDVVHVARGTYREQVVVSASGDAKAHIRIVCDDYKECKVLGQKYKPDFGAAVFLLMGTASYVDIEGFDVTDGDGKGNYGILGYGTFGNYRIVGNYVHDIPIPSCNANGGAGIDTEANAALTAGHSYIANNIVTRIGNATGCRHSNAIYVASDGSVVVNNVVYDVAGWGIDAWHNARNVVIAFNTVDRAAAGAIVYGTSPGEGMVPPSSTHIVNNIMTNSMYGFEECCKSSLMGEGNVYDHNLGYGNKKGDCLNGNDGAMSARCTNFIHADPKFVNAAKGDYRLRPSSPAIGAATQQHAPATDHNGRARLQSGRKSQDIGAYVHDGEETQAAGPLSSVVLPASGAVVLAVFAVGSTLLWRRLHSAKSSSMAVKSTR